MAFTRDWNESAPDGTDEASSGDDEIRNLKVEVSDRLKNMLYGLIAGENALAQHFQFLQFYEQASITTPSAGFGRLSCKAVSGKCELFWKDEDGDEIQLTTGGKWNGAVLLADSVDEDAIQLANDAALTAKDAAGTGTVDLIKAGRNEADDTDVAQIPDEARLATNAAPTEDTQLVNMKYVKDLITSTLTGTTDAIGEMTIGPLEIKWGIKALAANTNHTITFTTEGLTAFSNACFHVFACSTDFTNIGDVATRLSSTTTFQIRHNAAGTPSMRWFAIGY